MAKNINNLDKSLKQNITPADIGAATTSSVTTVSNNIGTLSSLKTSAKNNLVAAINEVFQSGANVKQQLVDALVANGASVSTSDSWDTLIGNIASGAGDYSNGTIDLNIDIKNTGTYTFNVLMGFVPDLLFIKTPLIRDDTLSSKPTVTENFYISNMNTTYICTDFNKSSKPSWSAIITNITDFSFDIKVTGKETSSFSWQKAANEDSIQLKWYAIKLPNSSGPERRLESAFNIEIANSLPAKVTEDRICIIEPNTNVSVYMDYITREEALVKYNFQADDIYVYLSHYEASNGYSSVMRDGTVVFRYNVCSIYKYVGSGLSICSNVYKGVDNQWVKMFGSYNLFSGGQFQNGVSMKNGHAYYFKNDIEVTGDLSIFTVNYNSSGSSYPIYTDQTFDVTNYKYLYIRVTTIVWGSLSGAGTTPVLYFGLCEDSKKNKSQSSAISATSNSAGQIFAAYAYLSAADFQEYSSSNTNKPSEKIVRIDVSSLTGVYAFMTIMRASSSYGGTVYISDIYFSVL